MRRHTRSDRGATIVEAAFTLPIFFLLLLGLVDFGLLAFESNKASNAARDGARVGIIDYVQADVVGSADYNALKAAIEKNLPGRTIPDADLTVQCLTPAGATVTCANAVLDQDRLSVSVKWQRNSISPLTAALGFGSVDVTGEARMTIAGRPIGSPVTPPPPCNITNVAVSPNSVERYASPDPEEGQLKAPLTVTVSGTGTCSNETVTLVRPDLSEVEICSSGCLGDTIYPAGADALWNAGSAVAEARDSSATVIDSDSFTVTDPVPPPVCQVTDVTPSLASVARDAGDNLTANVGFTLTGASVCTTLTVTLNAPGGGSIVICSGTCTNATYVAGSSGIWMADGFASIAVSGEGAPYNEANLFEVTTIPPCLVDIAIERDPVEIDNQNRLERYGSGNNQRRQQVTVSMAAGSGPCPSLTVVMTPPSGTNAVTLCNSGTCLGTFTYDGNDKHWGLNGSNPANVDVTGTGVAFNATFVVQDANP